VVEVIAYAIDRSDEKQKQFQNILGVSAEVYGVAPLWGCPAYRRIFD
jgi:hypothetical protein